MLAGKSLLLTVTSDSRCPLQRHFTYSSEVVWLLVFVCLEGVMFCLVWFVIQYVKAGREVKIAGTICW